MGLINLSLVAYLKGAGFVALIGFLLYIFWYKPEKSTTFEELSSHTEVVSSAVTRTVETTRPDGTHTIETTAQVDTAKVADKRAEKTSTVPATVSKSQYRLGVDYLPSLTTPPSPLDVAIRGGMRLGDSSVWVEGEIDLKHKQGSIGISVEW